MEDIEKRLDDIERDLYKHLVEHKKISNDVPIETLQKIASETDKELVITFVDKEKAK